MDNVSVILKKPSIVYINSSIIDSDRMDGEFYNNKYIENNIKLKKSQLKIEILNNIIETMNAPIGWQGIPSDSYMPHGEGIPLIRVQNVNDLILDEDSLIGVEEYIYDEQPAIQAQANDIIITRVGTVGRICRIPEKIDRIAMRQNLTRIKLKETVIESGFMLAYMASKFCQLQMKRYAYGGVQASLTNKNIRQLLIPIPSPEIQKYIGDKVRKAEELREEAKRLKKEAEEMFEKTLQIDDNFINRNKDKGTWVRENRININNITGDYYKQIYLEIENKMDSVGVKLLYLEEISKAILLGNTKKISDYYSEEGVPYITTKNVKTEGIDFKSLLYIPTDIHNNDLKKSKAFIGDILYNKSGNVGLSAILNDKYKEYNVVSDIIIIRPDAAKINAYYLVLFLNSKLGKNISERMAGGAIFQHISMHDITKIKVPILPIEIQNSIGDKKMKSELYNDKSKKLINEAKQDIGDLIEGNFDTSKIKEINQD